MKNLTLLLKMEKVVGRSISAGRVLMQDFTGVPAVVDLAAMRDAVMKMGRIHQSLTLKCQWIWSLIIRSW